MVARAGAVLRPRLPAPETLRLAGVLLLGLFAILLSSAIVVAAPILLRLAFFAAAVGVLFPLALGRPRTAVLATIGFLVVVAFVRRLLLPVSGWIPADPLLLVGPAVVALLFVQLFVLQKRTLAPDTISRLVLAVLGLSILQVANPIGAGFAANLVALLFVAVPLVWFFVGRELATPRLTRQLLGLVLVSGVVIGLYGLLQTEIGFPSWDQEWLDQVAYGSLNVGGTIRSFGTFSSFAEYALFIGSALAIAVAFALQGRTAALIAVPPLGAALFFSSNRGGLLTTVFAVFVLIGLRTRSVKSALAIVLAGVVIAGGALFAFSGSLLASASGSGNSLVAHQVGGLADPLNGNESTLGVHFALVVNGVKMGITHPLGQGTGATNGAAGLSQSDIKAAEVDLANAWINYGVVGGVLFLVLVVLTLATAIRAYLAGADHLFGVIGLLIVGLGQWLTGGHYALSPLTWILVGAVAASWTSIRRARGGGGAA
jgi:hypothetical protein